MSPTNIHCPRQLLSRAQSTDTDQALLQPANRLVLMVSGQSFPGDIRKYAWRLRSQRTGTWNQRDDASNTVKLSNLDSVLDVPQIFISPGLKQQNDTIKANGILYALVVQDRSGACKCKLMMKSDLERVPTTMMSDVLNGYSTVFSAAFSPRSHGPSFKNIVGHLNATFQKVTSWDNLFDSTTRSPTIKSLYGAEATTKAV